MMVGLRWCVVGVLLAPRVVWGQDSTATGDFHIGLTIHDVGLSIANAPRGLGAVSNGDIQGIVISGLGAVANRDIVGLAVAGLGTVTDRNLTGAGVAGLGVVANGALRGIGVGGLATVADGSITGVGIGGLAVVTDGRFTGFGVGGLAVVANDELRGVAMAGYSVDTHRMTGLSISAYNRVRGQQHGLKRSACTTRPTHSTASRSASSTAPGTTRLPSGSFPSSTSISKTIASRPQTVSPLQAS